MSLPVPYYDADGLQIFHADCGIILPDLATESIDMTCTDSPYGVSYQGRFDNKHSIIEGDDDLGWLEPVFAEVYRVMKVDSFAVCFYGWPHADRFVATWKKVGFRLVSHLSFVKNVPGLGHFTRSCHETAFLMAKGRPAAPEVAIPDAITSPRDRPSFHPNQKSLVAIGKVIEAFAPVQGVVLDPFLGSGTTLRAAKDLGLGGIGIEIDEDHCATAARRLAQGVLPFRRQKAPALPQVNLFEEKPCTNGL